MDDQTEVPPARDAESCDEPDGHGTGCLNRPGHDGPHCSRNRMWGEAALLSPCAERSALGGRCLKDAGHTGAHNDGDRLWGPSEPDVSWPPTEWRAPASVTVPQDLTARLDALERTVEHQRGRISHLAARLDALDGAAATAAEALRQHISEQASFTRRHVSVVLGTHVTRIEELIRELIRERDIVPEDPASSPCTATAQSPTGLVSCTQDEGHTGSHTNALAVWSDAPPVPPGGVYEVY